MANEYLQRTPTSTGNRRVWTLSGWVKSNYFDGYLFSVYSGAGDRVALAFNTGTLQFRDINTSTGTQIFETNNRFRDHSNWLHYVISVNTTLGLQTDRVKMYVNGVLQTSLSSSSMSQNIQTYMNALLPHRINDPSITELKHEIFDYFFVDGQALTPDVFGFYKQGKGYISAGSTQATDFRPGQWVPKTPRVIKTEINRRGGFGVNGFYLPMNDSNNFGADFHCDPNSIITLNEKLPQPRVGVATTAAVGLGYTDVLRADPYAANLVLALPFVSSGLCTNGTNVGVNTGFGDYSAIIKGSGSANIGTHHQSSATIINVSSASSAGGYYGSSAYFDGGDIFDTRLSIGNAFANANYTIEFWMNADKQTGEQGIFGVTTSSGGQYSIDLNMRDTVTSKSFYATFGGGGAGNTVEVGIITHKNQWNHIAMVKNGSTGTLYLNGTAIGVATNVSPTSFTTGTLKIGNYYENAGNYFYQGYLQDFRVYNTAKYKGGFDVPKPYTPVGIATWRAVPDCTANNFATWNPLIGAGVNAGDTVPALLSGNLYLDNANQTWAPATIGVSTGKWYAEFMCLNGVQGSNIGVSGDSIAFRNSQDFFNKVGVSYVRLASSSITKQFTSTSTTSGSIGYTSGDIVGVTLDVTNKEIKFFKNNVGIFTDTTLSGFTTTNTHYYFTPFRTNDGSSGADWSDVVANFGQNPSFSGNTTAGTFTDSNGKGLFKYQPPSGFLALCEDNLPTPAISDPGDYFKTVLYTGTGTVNAIKGVGFQPDFVWGKRRNNTGNLWIFDSVRGATNQIVTNSTNAEVPGSTEFISFDSDGFTVTSTAGSFNNSGDSYVAWCWRAGAGTTSTNTNGSITSVVSVNQDAGFSIVSYTGTGANATVGHGLNKKPKMVIVKRRDAVTNWPIWFEGVSTNTDQVLQLNLTNASASASTFFNSSNTTTTTFPLGSGGSQTNASGSPHIAYCWAEIEGFSKFGSYVGNGNADGPFVYCGFKPAFILIKNITNAQSWQLMDSSRGSVNPNVSTLFPNLSNIEDNTANSTDFLSNGFKIRNSSSGNTNNSGDTYIFAAWAESPFSYSNSK